MRRLSEPEFTSTMGTPMAPIAQATPAPSDFWPYVDGIPAAEYQGNVPSGEISHAWREPTGRWDHVLLATETPNVFMVIVVDRSDAPVVHGHHLLDLNRHYGLDQPS